MSERYSKLYSLTENLYLDGAPVIISAGALLKDNNTGKILAQLKIKSITDKTIKAVKVCIVAYDTVSRVIDEQISHQYLDLSAKRDEEFGQKTAIYMPDDSTREFKVAITEVAFADNTVWTEATDKEWEALPELKPLLPDNKELLKQYRIEINKKAKNEFCETDGLWFCACGSINDVGEEKCHRCGTLVPLMKNCDLNFLREKCNERINAEKEEIKIAKEKEEKEAQEKREKEARKRKRSLKIGIAILTMVAIVVAAGFITNMIIMPYIDYKAAVSLMEDGKYDEAIEKLENQDGYNDSKDMINECLYRKAGELLESDDYSKVAKAVELFNDLGEYRDSLERTIEAKNKSLYLEAMLAFEGKRDSWWAWKIFISLGDYKDSKEKAFLMRKEYDYSKAMELYNNQDYKKAEEKFKELGNYKDSADMIIKTFEMRYQQGMDLLEKGEIFLDEAYFQFKEIEDYKDARIIAEKCLADMYAYLISHKLANVRATRDYLDALKETEKYGEKVASIYEELYPWNVSVQWNITGTCVFLTVKIFGGKAGVKKHVKFYVKSKGNDGSWSGKKTDENDIYEGGEFNMYFDRYYPDVTYQLEVIIDNAVVAVFERDVN